MSQRVRRDVTDDFKREAVRLTQTSGRTIKQVADDLGIGLSTLTGWKRRHHDAELLAHPHDDVENLAAHGWDHAGPFQEPLIIIGTILAAAIGVMDESCRRVS